MTEFAKVFPEWVTEDYTTELPHYYIERGSLAGEDLIWFHNDFTEALFNHLVKEVAVNEQIKVLEVLEEIAPNGYPYWKWEPHDEHGSKIMKPMSKSFSIRILEDSMDEALIQGVKVLRDYEAKNKSNISQGEISV